jgi:hypothetical protein
MDPEFIYIIGGYENKKHAMRSPLGINTSIQ